MPKNITECYAKLDEALTLEPQVAAKAKKLRDDIDEVLKDHGWMETSLLQGSYGRKTMYPPLKDVDLVIVLPESLSHYRSDPKGPAKVIAGFRLAIESSQKFSGVRFDLDDRPAHALQLTFPGVPFTFDLVPAFESGNPNWLYIADRDEERWDEKSDVRALRNKVMARNVLTGGVWVRQVRQSKHALRQVPAVKALVCGLLVESLAYDAVTKAMSPQKAAEAIFAQGAKVLGRSYSGLALDDLTAKWTPEQRAQVVAFYTDRHRLAIEALKLEADDPVAASLTWAQVFGSAFPEVQETLAERVARTNRLGGGTTSTGVLTTSPRVRAASPPARPWRAT
ncbi:MAG: nucleotidyltransferase [Kineosporiaceae bacterium]|nr:nucleotidyltransferase [Kineosporiaceae bacterium]